MGKSNKRVDCLSGRCTCVICGVALTADNRSKDYDNLCCACLHDLEF
jgi:hypothetical protein